nr:hypothetical protein CoNPh37_CDS0063 [Staphylococcus phage S-CoN_Ph37]
MPTSLKGGFSGGVQVVQLLLKEVLLLPLLMVPLLIVTVLLL